MSKTYIIRFAIDGEIELEAASADEAQAKFNELSREEIACAGDLFSDDPKTREQIRNEIAALREGMPVN